MFQTLYDLSVEIIGSVPVGLEILYVFCSLILFFIALKQLVTILNTESNIAFKTSILSLLNQTDHIQF